MPKKPDQSAESTPLPSISPETARGRQRLSMGILSLGFAVTGGGVIAAGQLGYLNEYPTVIMGSALVFVGAMGAINRRRI